MDGAKLRITPTGNGSSEIRITANDGKGGSTAASFRFTYYGEIQNMRHEVQSDFINLYWDEYGEEGVTYHVYMVDELFESTSTPYVSLTGLKPDTVYNLRVTAVDRDDEIKAWTNYLVTTLPIDFESLEVTVNSITVAWRPYEGKRFVLILNDQEFDPSLSLGGTYTFTGLSSNTSYTIRIEAWDDQNLWATRDMTVKTEM